MNESEFDLLFQGRRVARVRYQGLDQPWIVGEVVRLTQDPEIRRQLAALVADPPVDLSGGEVDSDFLDESNWALLDQEGAHLKISVPALHERKRDVFWRWR